MVQSSILGFPRMGRLRDLKKATEAYWGGKISRDDLLKEGKRLRLEHWQIQKDAGVDLIPSNDFAFYDQVLDHIQLFGVIPERYSKYGLHPLDEYFAMGRGLQRPAKDGEPAVDVPSLEMVKWFDSNYHYVKPTLQDNQEFKLSANPKPVVEFKEAKEAGINTRPVILGPVSFLVLAKADRGQSVDPISLLEKLLPLYEQLLIQLKEAGAETVQIDEPVLVFDLAAKAKAAFKPAYEKLGALGDKAPRIVFATYFGDIVHNIDVLAHLQSLYAIHVDLVRNPEQLETVIGALGPNQILSAGVVDGRNIWKTNFKRAIEIVELAIQKLGKDRVIVASSSSLLHTPHTLESEKKLDPEVRDWFSFAVEKAAELVIIAKAVTEGPAAVREQLEANAKSIQARASSKRTNDPKVKERQAAVTDEMHNRQSQFPERISQQQKHLNLPMFPTTTIGSFPQTSEIRIQRNKFTKGEITAQQYEQFIEKEIQDVVKIQEEWIWTSSGQLRPSASPPPGVKDSTQIHSHFCYSEFQDFFHAIAALDADVLSIENSKSDAKLLKVFVDEKYPRHIGPGVYDIHSPRVPSEQEIKDRIEEMLQFLQPDQLWIDPDCGLKTRQWAETKAALTNMVNAAKYFRQKYSK
ncbi:5-methyltetrahydropteroyltriglutamate-homocysteine methyltransferase [Coccidioides immitis H538.4]|uniref:5-methyltetrahydropteroyltriglutamate--homocysteine S-methyltransferase n=1 Tax=Coccidioides immitis H538.4 TaxID=396776 RepID=A0A0J8RV60_COCIT|nr:5-methyltetrahydropteroyltriglutamate-homocysteine methyltransferase [Coccidioides immitis H538.4]